MNILCHQKYIYIFLLCIKCIHIVSGCGKKNNVETIKYNGKKWINEKHLEKTLGYRNLASNKIQYYCDEFKKRRFEIQDWEDFQPFRKFIAEELAVDLIIDIKTVKAAELTIKLGFNQVDPIMSKQISIGLRIRKAFPNEKIIEDFYVKEFDYMIDFYLPKRKLAIEIDKLGHFDRDQITENKRQKELEEYLGVHLLELILMKKILVLTMGLVKYRHLLIS